MCPSSPHHNPKTLKTSHSPLPHGIPRLAACIAAALCLTPETRARLIDFINGIRDHSAGMDTNSGTLVNDQEWCFPFSAPVDIRNRRIAGIDAAPQTA